MALRLVQDDRVEQGQKIDESSLLIGLVRDLRLFANTASRDDFLAVPCLRLAKAFDRRVEAERRGR